MAQQLSGKAYSMGREYGLGRLHNPDPLNARFPMTAALGPSLVLVEKVWTPGPILDQGQTPHCVGYAGAQWRQMSGHTLVAGRDDGESLYYACKVKDNEPRAEDGSTDNSLMKVLQDLGEVGAYHWASTPEEIATWLSTKGPVLFGTPWLQGMFTPRADDTLPLTGRVVGGHEYIAIGIHPRKTLTTTLVEYVNSWGTGWGKAGHFFMTLGNAMTLIKKGGDACAAVEVS